VLQGGLFLFGHFVVAIWSVGSLERWYFELFARSA
jgi:hypothetical protein